MAGEVTYRELALLIVGAMIFVAVASWYGTDLIFALLDALFHGDDDE